MVFVCVSFFVFFWRGIKKRSVRIGNYLFGFFVIGLVIRVGFSIGLEIILVWVRFKCAGYFGWFLLFRF